MRSAAPQHVVRIGYRVRRMPAPSRLRASRAPRIRKPTTRAAIARRFTPRGLVGLDPPHVTRHRNPSRPALTGVRPIRRAGHSRDRPYRPYPVRILAKEDRAESGDLRPKVKGET